jgi:hypothetical protein
MKDKKKIKCSMNIKVFDKNGNLKEERDLNLNKKEG